MGNKNYPGEQFKTFISDMKKDLNAIKNNFTLRTFFVITFGFALIVFNVYLYFVGMAYAIGNYHFLSIIMGSIFGSIGILVSIPMIMILAIHIAADKNVESGATYSGTSLLSSALEDQSPQRKKKVFVAILVYVMIFGVGIGTITYYLVDKANHSNYIKVTAVIKTLVSGGDDGYKCGYGYTYNGVEYYTIGNVVSSGEATPRVGDTITIEIDPNNPNVVYLGNEKMFFLIFGGFFLWCGLILVFYELVRIGVINIRLFVGFILLGLSFVIGIIPFMNSNINSLTQYVGKNMWVFFIFLFTNIGIMQFLEGIIDFNKLKRSKIKRINSY